MRVLVTGSEGRIGRVVAQTLRQAGHQVRSFDRKPGSGAEPDQLAGDLRDRAIVQEAVAGMEAVVHLGAIPGDWAGHDAEVMEINVQGTWNVLQSCVEQGVARAVCFSSIQALGNVCGFRPSLYLPIDDAYPRHPMSAYQLSKHLNEETCRSFTNRHGMATICFRPVGVLREEHYANWRSDPPDVARPGTVSNYWAYVDVRDVADAVLKSLSVEGVTHDAFLLAADDSTTATPTAELVRRFYPDTPWRQDEDAYFSDNPCRSPVDCGHAKDVLGWQPRHTWRGED